MWIYLTESKVTDEESIRKYVQLQTNIYIGLLNSDFIKSYAGDTHENY